MPKADRSKIRLKMISLSSNRSLFKYHKGMPLDGTDPDKLKKLSQDIRESIPDTYIPYVIREAEGEPYTLINRHLPYKLQQTSDTIRHYILVEGADEDAIAAFHDTDRDEIKHIQTLLKRLSIPIKQSAKTIERENKRQNNLTCPECSDVDVRETSKKGRKRKPGALCGPRNGKPIDKTMVSHLYIAACFDYMPADGDTARKLYLVTCDNYQQFQDVTQSSRRCGFGCLVNVCELAEFQYAPSPFTHWVEKVAGEKCPGHGCKHDLYVRTFRTELYALKVVVCGSKFDMNATHTCNFEMGYYEWVSSRKK